MNEIDKKKYLKLINRNKKNSSESGLRKYFKGLFIRITIVLLIFLSVAIICKKESILKDKIYNYLYTDNIAFTKINKLYNKYLGGILPLKNAPNTNEVFNEKLKYSDLSIYHDGIKLSVDESYLVPSLDEGMVVFIGEKENYGNVIIVENLDGINFWYGNLTNTPVKLYDYVEKGTLLGEANNNLYLVFSREDQYLNYEDYLF